MEENPSSGESFGEFWKEEGMNRNPMALRRFVGDGKRSPAILVEGLEFGREVCQPRCILLFDIVESGRRERKDKTCMDTK